MEMTLDLTSVTLDVLTGFYPCSLAFAGLWLWGLVATRRYLKDRPWRLARWCLLPGTITIVVFLGGVVFRDGGPMPGGEMAGLMLLVLVLAHFPLGILLGTWAGPQWPVVAASSCAWGWVSCCAAFVAGMSVTGDWL